jgi:hypothetical protein
VCVDADYLPNLAYSLELLELYLELILARFALLELNPKEKVPDEGVREAVCSVVYAAPRYEGSHSFRWET